MHDRLQKRADEKKHFLEDGYEYSRGCKVDCPLAPPMFNASARKKFGEIGYHTATDDTAFGDSLTYCGPTIVVRLLHATRHPP